MIEEEIIVGDDNDISHEFQVELLPPVVLSEMNFLRFPFFALHCRGLRKNNKEMVYEFTNVRDGKRVRSKLSIIPSVRYGRPTAFDRRVARAIDMILDEAYARNGYRLENPISFSIYRVAELMGKKFKRSGRLYEDIKESIERIRATTVKSEGSFYLQDEEVWIDRSFSFYTDVLFMGMRKTDGEIAETNYLSLHDLYLRSINARYVKPLDYTFLVSLKNDLASRLYEVLSPKFYGLDDGVDYYHIDYLRLCNALPITPQKYFSNAQQNLKPAHNELALSGYLSKVTYVLYKGRQQIRTVRYYPGERAKREMRGEFGQRGKTVLIEEQLALPLTSEQDSNLTGLAQELYNRGIKPKRVAIELSENHDEDYIREKIEIFDFHMKADDGTISDNPPGWLRTAIETDIEPTKNQVKSSKAAIRQQVEEQVKEMELKKGKIKKPYEEECEGIFEKIIVENTQAVDDAMQEALKENPILEQFYDVSKPFGDQKGMVQAMTKPKLRARFAEMFKKVDGEYGKKIEKIDKQIVALKDGVG